MLKVGTIEILNEEPHLKTDIFQNLMLTFFFSFEPGAPSLLPFENMAKLFNFSNFDSNMSRRISPDLIHGALGDRPEVVYHKFNSQLYQKYSLHTVEPFGMKCHIFWRKNC
jgi:hypothetical protein